MEDVVSQTSKSVSLAATGGEGEASISDKLQDHPNHVFIRQKSQQLSGEAAVPHSVMSRCQIDKHSTDLFLSFERVLDILCEQNGLVHVYLPCQNPACSPGSCGLIIGKDKPFEDLVGDTKKRYRMIALRVLLRLLGFSNRDYQQSFPDFGNFESTQEGKMEAT